MATGDFHFAPLKDNVPRIIVPATSNLETDMQTADPTRVLSPRPENDARIGVFLDEIAVLAERSGIVIGHGRADGNSVRRSANPRSHVRTWSIEIPLIGGNGEISGVLCRDVPIVERADPTIRSKPQGLGTGNETAKVFVHDINNLLSVIGGGLNLLERQCNLATQDAILVCMREAIARGAALSRSLLDAGKHPNPPASHTTSRADVVAAAEPLCQGLSERTEMEIEISSDLWEFGADPEKLYFALLNVCRNADAAMQCGGVVSITAANLDPAPIAPEGAVLITVADNGSGMSKKSCHAHLNPATPLRLRAKGRGWASPRSAISSKTTAAQSGSSLRRVSERWFG
jgi:signal transduction histidine kinase